MSSKTQTTAMKEEAKPALVPKLRFPEFRGAEPWKVSRFDEVLSPVVRQRPKPAEAYLGLGLRSHGKGTFLKPLEDPAKNSMDQLYEVKAHDLIVNITFAWEGAVAIAQECDEGALVSHRFPTYTFEKGRTAPEFFRYIILGKQFVYNLGVISPGGAGRNRVLSKNDFLKLRVALPMPAEQQKIAECLSSMDDLMAAQARKVDALKTHKKGLMQQLFPREGETQPRLRFSNRVDWAVVALPEVAFFQEGPGIMAVDFHSEGVPLVRLAGVSGPVVTLDGCNYLDPAKVAQKWTHFRLEVNDLLISTSATFGLSSLVTKAAAGAVFYTGLIRFRPSSERLDRGYLKIFLGSPHFGRQVETAAVGGGIKHFGPSHLKQMEIPIPPLDEQQRIAMCLSSLDALITAETQKLEALKIHKKGLMQQLFPNMETCHDDQ